MKLSWFIFYIFVMLLLGTACENEIELIDQTDPLPIVFGILNPADTTHYIRIERSFADPNTSAYLLAQDPDQFYFESAEISLTNSRTGTQYELERVDAGMEGYPRKTGDFANVPNYLYKISSSEADLKGKDNITLEIIEGEFATPKTSTAIILSAPDIRNPRFVNGQGFIEFTEGKQTEVTWRTTSNAGSYIVKFILNIREENLTTGEKEDIALEWPLDEFVDGDEIKFDGVGFFIFLNGVLDAKTGYRRQFLNVDVIVQAFDHEITKYIEVAGANTGITGAQEIPTYTNVIGGLGIFGASSTDRDNGFNLKNRTLDSLFDGRYTKHLNFTP